jgi:hypothetical protein
MNLSVEEIEQQYRELEELGFLVRGEDGELRLSPNLITDEREARLLVFVCGLTKDKADHTIPRVVVHQLLPTVFEGLFC